MTHRTRIPVTALSFGLALMTAAPALAFGPRDFDTTSVRVGKFLGTVEITADPGARGMTVKAEGAKELLDRVIIRQQGTTLVVEMDMPSGKNIQIDDEETPTVSLRVPVGADLEVGDIIGVVESKGELGNLRVDTESAASLSLAAVQSADVDTDGAVNLDIAVIAKGAQLELSGASNAEIGHVRGGLVLALEGIGNVSVDRADGKVDLSLDGLGRIHVRDGDADPLTVDVDGMGAVTFNGKANRVDVSKTGFASVEVNGREY